MLSPELIRSLFEQHQYLFATFSDELAAVVRGDKGCCVNHQHQLPAIDSFIRQATSMGLSVQRRHAAKLVDGRDIVELVATRPGEEWRAEVAAWYRAAAKHGPPSLRDMYMQSRMLGYSHEQAADFIKMRKHLTPVHLEVPIYFLLPVNDAERIRSSGELWTNRPIQMAALTIFMGGLRRDALTLLPRDYMIGRSALKRGIVNEFFPFEPLRILIAECAVHRQRQLAGKLLCPIDFWDGEIWN